MMLKLICLGLSACALVVGATPPLIVSLETGWSAPPLLLEILETVHDEDSTAYMPFLRLLAISNNFSGTTEDVLSKSTTLIRSHSLLPELSTFHLALALHTTVPRIEAAYSWYMSNIDETELGIKACSTWVEWKGKGFCDVESLTREMDSSGGAQHHGLPRCRSLPFDRVSRSRSGPQAILYLDLPSTDISTSSLIAYLDRYSTADPTFSYIIRYRPSINASSDEKRTRMAGYGVELALKKTDYLVVDDRDTGSGSTPFEPSESAEEVIGGTFQEILGENPWSELAIPLSKFEVMDLGLKASALVMSSSNPLDALQELSQDFPKYSAALSRRVPIPAAINKKADLLARRGPDSPAIYINGKAYSHPDVNAYSLLKAIRAEKKLAGSLVSIGLTPKQAFQILSDPVIGQKQTVEEAGEGVVDASDREEGGDVIVWWNNIEKDSRYKQWSSSLTGYLRPTYPGQLHTVRKNTWNVVVVLDLSLARSLETITQQIAHMIQRGIPLRFGVIPMFDPAVNDISLQMAKLYLYSVKTFGRGKTSQMLAENAYERMQAASDKESLPFDQVIGSTSMSDALEKLVAYQSRLLVTKDESPQGHMFINGKYSAFSSQWTTTIQSELSTQIAFLQEQLQSGYPINDIANFFYDLPGVPKRRSKIIIPTAGDHALTAVNLPDLFHSEAAKRLATDFVYPADAARGTPMSIWVIGDLDSFEGIRIVKAALSRLESEDCSSRLAFIHIPSPRPSSEAHFSTILYNLISTSALQTITPRHLLDLVEELEKSAPSDNLDKAGWILSDSAQEAFQNTPLHAFLSSGQSAADIATAAEFWKAGSELAQTLVLNPDHPYLLVNGRLVGPLTSNNFAAEDIAPLEAYEYRKRTKPVFDLLRTMYDDMSMLGREVVANLVSSASSTLTLAYKSDEGDSIFVAPPIPRSRYYESLDQGAMSFTVGDVDTALIRVAAVLDPISEEAQVWSDLLKTAAEMDNIAVSVYLEPDTQKTEVKLKRFYRSLIPNRLTFGADGGESETGVTFVNLPSDPIFTLALNAPPAWVVSPQTSPYDLDNLLLASITSPIHVSFRLKQLLIEGHAREKSNAPPRGLQLQLTRNGIEVSDTLVMANVGYLQFKVTPGVYDLSIRPGRGRDVFEMESTGTTGWDSKMVNETGTEVVLASLEGMTILPRFKRRPGMETEDVLQEAQISSTANTIDAVWSRLKEMIGLPASTPSATKGKHADINIFTVASGLLYERFASIMILSVMKHTQSTVKFWFIENFLSPSFLAFIPHMAGEYGFEYELVTYKWPHWLRAQTEKQRIIWAYKILFLDVLFPMDLDKVIFVDADQIVRTDMRELVDLDLRDHVYGYPPMGDDRHEMEGFRFWKTGYWKDALRGRPYHISALYVVDLKRFRQLATGDRLRGQYHALSADPNSLANLDQDLPNSMQDQIPIFTLDQDWLWCQTWCSDESLATAKTIDLCQNPLTKEPKLARARQIPEWDIYDREVAAFARRIEGKAGKAMASSVEALAGDAIPDTLTSQHAEEAPLVEDRARRIEDEL